MASSVIGSLRVDLGLNSAKFSRGMSDAQKRLKVARNQFAAMAGVATAMGAAISAAAIKGAQEIDRVAKAARRLDTSIGGFRAMELAAGEAGVSLSSLTNDVQTLEREIANIGVSGNADRALKALGLSAKALEGSTADEKLATIADRVKELGLSTGEASAVLRDLGIRNREMVLLVQQGGDALRDARKDIADYGLALSAVDAGKIEAANDQIGRLSLITQYLGQRLAVELVPALGRFAEAMTNSLREGGLLRSMIDGLAGSLDVLAASLAALTAVAGVRLVLALAAATKGVGLLTGALTLLRGAVALAGGPWGVLAALVAGAATYMLGFKKSVHPVTEAIDSAKESQEALNAVLGTFYQTAAPSAGKEAVELANNNYKLAQSALAAAEAEVAKMEAIKQTASQEFENDWYLQGKDSSKMDAALDRQVAKAEERAERARKVLDEAKRALDRAAKAVTGAKSETMSKELELAKDLTISIKGLSAATGGAGAAALDAAGDIEQMNIGLQEQNPLIDSLSRAWGDFVGRGFKDFKGFAKGVLDTFKQMLLKMIFTANANRIPISIGMSGGVAGTAASAMGGAGGGGLGMLGQFGGIGGGILGTLGSTAAGTVGTGLIGGFGNAMGIGLAGFNPFAIGANAALAGGGAMATAGAALGAVALPILGIAAAVSFFKTKTKLLDSGIRVTVKNMDVLAQTFKKVEKSKFWGLSKKTRTTYKNAGKEMTSGIQSTVDSMGASVLEMASAFGAGEDALDNFSAAFTLSLKGLSKEKQQEKIAEALGEFSDKMVAEIFSTTSAVTDSTSGWAGNKVFAFLSERLGNIGLFSKYAGRDASQATKTVRRLSDAFLEIQREGEGATETLQRIYLAITGVNDAMDLLGHTLMDATLKGGDLASTLVDAFGGLDAMTQAVGVFWQNFYTEQERLDTTTRRLGEAFEELGYAMPTSRKAFRDLIEGIDTTSHEGATLYAELMKLAGGMNDVLAPVEELTKRTRDMVRSILTDLDLMPTSRGQYAARGGIHMAEVVAAAQAGDMQAVRGYLRDIKAQSVSDLAYRETAARVLAQFGSGNVYGTASGPIDLTAGSGKTSEQQIAERFDGLREEIRLLREENRQLGLRADQQRKTTADTLEKWDRTGMPMERTQ
ncbi:hypothetical protein [Pontibaca salina]|uniref:Uncharacterized protein n=1 Tax=Pontibaca salina TaxID=2795731 RepID=A0A934LX85_9RHOB|nr:hypothetical protein [Pontibaca salina]MBI6628317.1 hypothetical protein [Pontibaca salina]